VTAISLLSGITSGISFLGMPGYSYKHGPQMLFFAPAYIFATSFTMYVSLPFFARPELKFVTAYSYLEARFSRTVRKAVAASFILRVVIYMGFVLYAPAIAIETVAGLNFYITVTVCGVFATLYTMKGGMSSVIWTDFIASLALVFGIVICMGFAVGGIDQKAIDGNSHSTSSKSAQMWAIASAHGRSLGPHFFAFTPLAAYDFWSIFLGMIFSMAAQAGTDQISVQRYLSCKSIRSGQIVALVSGILNCLSGASLTVLGMCCGLVYCGGIPYGARYVLWSSVRFSTT
jgi:Na+/proline symporter